MDRRFLFATAILTLWSPPAFADTRDEVMAAMQRCGAFPDDRTWLECTYGAQQLMRAKLGLAPAPDYQQRLVPPITSATPPPAPAIAAPGVNAPPRSATAPVPRRKASFMQILTGSAAPVAVSPLSAIDYDRNGAFLITLQNGQTWRQVNPDTGLKAKLKVGATMTIRPGALGSFNLHADGESHLYKVEPKN